MVRLSSYRPFGAIMGNWGCRGFAALHPCLNPIIPQQIKMFMKMQLLVCELFLLKEFGFLANNTKIGIRV